MVGEIRQEETDDGDKIVVVPHDGVEYHFGVKNGSKVVYFGPTESAYDDTIDSHPGYPPEVGDRLESEGYEIV